MRQADQTLAMLLKRLREERDISQEQLAFATGLSVSGLSKIERGVNNPTWTSVWDIAKALGVEMCELVADVEAAQAYEAAPTSSAVPIRRV